MTVTDDMLRADLQAAHEAVLSKVCPACGSQARVHADSAFGPLTICPRADTTKIEGSSPEHRPQPDAANVGRGDPSLRCVICGHSSAAHNGRRCDRCRTCFVFVAGEAS